MEEELGTDDETEGMFELGPSEPEPRALRMSDLDALDSLPREMISPRPMPMPMFRTYEYLRMPTSGLIFGGTGASVGTWITSPLGGIGREPEAMELRVGDRVEYIGPTGRTEVQVGDTGEVIAIEPNHRRGSFDGYRVRWLGPGHYRGHAVYSEYYRTGDRSSLQWAPEAIRRIEERREPVAEAVRREVEGFGQGDRVRYVYTGERNTNPGFGVEGTVSSVGTSIVRILWDAGPMHGREWEARIRWEGHPEYQVDTLENLSRPRGEAEPETESPDTRTLVNGDRVVYVGPVGGHGPAIPYGTQGVVDGTYGEGDSWGGSVRWELERPDSWHYGVEETEPWWLRSALCHIDDWLDPEFPYKVGLRYYHYFVPGSSSQERALLGNGSPYILTISEIDRERRRVTTVDHNGHNQQYGDNERENYRLERLVAVEGQTGGARKEKAKMLSTCSLQVELSEGEKAELGRWIKRVLDNPVGDNRWPTTLFDRVAVCYQGQIRIIRDERWIDNSPYLYAGRPDRAGEAIRVPISHRLAVAMTLMQLVDAGEELKTAARAALGRYLLGEYQELSKGVVVVSKKKPEGLAFSADKVAAKIGEEWVLPTTGEPVKVEGSEWTICSM